MPGPADSAVPGVGARAAAVPLDAARSYANRASRTGATVDYALTAVRVGFAAASGP